MNIAKHIPTLTRIFSRKPKQASLPLNEPKLIKEDFGHWPDENPAEAKEAPRKRVPSYYITTDESPWGIISYEQGKWRVALYYVWATREAAREEARKYSKSFNVRTRVVRLIVPTR